ncbi:two-component regulator propeller domain-containing protein [Flavobacterium sp.]|uniref:type IX secretion system anionic LPS delivery protein PorZ n=1 Tax=Flavobacterium sp. TaxID=239 RepID=UPI0037501267
MQRIIFFFFLFSIAGFSQENLQWQGYFSYNKINDVTESTNEISAASENALFSKNISTNDISTINSIDGLKINDITSVYRSDAFNITLIGNTKGLLVIIKPDGSIILKRGIIDEVPVSPLIKRINHFYEHESKVYISTDYGISVFDLTTQEFGDTYYIGNSGENIKVFQTTVFNDEIYATTQYYGIKKAAVSNPNLIDFNQWLQFYGDYWSGVVNYNNQLVGAHTNGKAYKFVGNVPTEFSNFNFLALDIRENDGYVIITTLNSVHVYNEAFLQVAQIQTTQITEIPVTFVCATVINDVIYIGTNENGIVSTTISSPTSFEFIMPDGPVLNNIFRLKKSTTALWALYGRYDRGYNPYNGNFPYGLFQYPISKFTTEEGWDMIPYSDLFGAKSLSNITFNPTNENEFYVSSYFSGLLKVVDEVPTVLYDNTNTGSNGLESPFAAAGLRINGPVYDKNGNLWMTNNYVDKALKVLRANGNWESYDLSEVITETFNESYAIPVVDKNNTKWLPSIRNGLIAFNETLSNKSIVIKTETQGNLPDIDVRCVALDKRNQLWIGTARGLRIITSVDQFLSEEMITTKDIIIEEDGLAQELFYQQFILDIAVDGANRKWVSLADSGVYLVSPNGQETIYKFTIDNSPLPSNNVNDIEIDNVTGEVFFATDKGLVSFKGTATKPEDNLNNVYVYPNPVRPEFSGTIKISGLTDKAIIKIADIEGNLVYETTSSGGTIEWDGTAFGKYRVASGVYMIFVSAQDGIETKVKKVMIIR